MNRLRIISFLFLCLVCGLLSSCLEDIDLDTGERILNVYCILREGPEQELELSYIAPTGGISRPVVQDATITLFDGGTPVGQFTRVSETKWNLDYKPEGGHRYRLEVNVPGEEILSAETKYPPVSILQEVYLPRIVEIPGIPAYTGSYRAYKLDSDEDQVLWCCYLHKNDGQVFSEYVATDHPGVDGRGESIYIFDFNSSIWNHAFYVSSQFFYGDGFPHLHEKVVRIVHPAGFNRSDENAVFVHLDEHDQVISQEEGKASMFCISGVNKSYLRTDLVICSVSDEYDAYLIDYYYSQNDSEDFTLSVYKRNYYSNIRNGTGVFGACHEYRRENLNIKINPYEPYLE